MLRSNESDEELMTRYQGGSEEAFKALYSRHAGKIYGYLKLRARTVEEVNDLMQEVFVKIHKSKHLYNRSFPVLPWIFSVTHSVLVDGIRSRERKKEIFDFDFDQVSTQVPEEDKMAAVRPLIGKLPDNQGVALHMRYVDEKTFEEIASSLRTSPTNVRQIVSRGVKNLKRLINEGEKP